MTKRKDYGKAPFLTALLLVVAALPLLSVGAGAAPVTLYLAGDSTMAPKLPEKRPETGWGEALQAHFPPAKLVVENHARNGRSTRTFIEEGRWRAIVKALAPGDYVFMQFGHNDGSESKPKRYTSPQQYRKNLSDFIADVRDAGANPVLLTPVVRRRFDEQGNFYDTHGPYPGAVRAISRDLGVPLLDMHRDTGALLMELGASASRDLFLILAPGQSANYPDGLDDNTHFSPAGAERAAAIAVREMRELELPLVRYLSSASSSPE